MNYIIVDLEWNQSDDGEEPKVKEIPFEIIDIGAVKLNSRRVMIGEFNELVKPAVYRHMHKITGDLIHLHMKDLQKSRSFREVMESFLAWCGTDYIFCTWGTMDLLELQRNMHYYHMPPLSDKPIRFLDVQKLFSIAYEDSKVRRSLEYAVNYLNIKKDIPFHRAFSDAYYTAKILAHLTGAVLENYSIDTYILPANRQEEIHVMFHDYMKYISREFPDKQTALKDREVTSTKCYYCHRNLKRKIRWFTPNGKHFYSLSYCEKHGYLKGKIRVRKSGEEGVYIVKTLKFIPDEDVSKIKERQDKARILRKQRRHHGKSS